VRILLILTLLSSCALSLPERKVTKEDTITDKVHKCVVELVGKFAVHAKEAQEVCDKVYRRQ